ncbi:MAG: tRNA glutamyl-Q(34) synthetase GluQRS [Gammaproteobacteria bacterium]|jgi:glutamyl-Q tRNA(Asp) synthetase
MIQAPQYRGRFAPSPTGPLHFGSLVAAVGSYLDARHHDGCWLVRMEDLDPPREVPGAGDSILRTLESFGLEWDGAVEYQSRRGNLYETALEQLARDGHLYHCACTRREIADSTTGPERNPVYPGTCRNGLPPGRQARAVRVRVYDTVIALADLLQGSLDQRLDREVGDFVLRRADGLYAYQLAVVVDDAEQQVTHVVRGSDLLGSTPRQVYLQQLLDYATPRYLHLPVAVNASREKLGKQTLAPAVLPTHGVGTLVQALAFLNQPLPEGARDATPGELLAWAATRWNRRALPARRQRTAPAGFQHATPAGL